MPIDAAPLERAGLHVAVAELEALFQSALEALSHLTLRSMRVVHCRRVN
jgi:hypothetical protein